MFTNFWFGTTRLIFNRYLSQSITLKYPYAKNLNNNKIYNPKYLKYNKETKKNTQIVNKKREIEDKKNTNNLKHKIELHESHSPKKIIYY